MRKKDEQYAKTWKNYKKEIISLRDLNDLWDDKFPEKRRTAQNLVDSASLFEKKR